MIQYIEGEDIISYLNEYDVILVGTNTYCTMSQGFQLKVMLNFPYVMEDNMKTKYGDRRKLGTIFESKKDNEPTFCLCFITNGYNFRPDVQQDYLSYESLGQCLKVINVVYKGMRVGTTLLGCSRFDGNGDKEKVRTLFSENCKDVDIDIYDYEQLSRSEELKNMHKAELKLKKSDPQAYYKQVAKRKKEAEIRFNKNKHRRY